MDLSGLFGRSHVDSASATSRNLRIRRFSNLRWIDKGCLCQIEPIGYERSFGLAIKLLDTVTMLGGSRQGGVSIKLLLCSTMLLAPILSEQLVWFNRRALRHENLSSSSVCKWTLGYNDSTYTMVCDKITGCTIIDRGGKDRNFRIRNNSIVLCEGVISIWWLSSALSYLQGF